MAALGFPSNQSKSNRNLFSEASVAPIVKFEQIVFSTDLGGIEISPDPAASPSKKALSPMSNSGGKAAKSPTKTKKRSPRKSPKAKGSSKDGDGFFSKLFCAFTGYSSSGTYRPLPVAKGVYFDIRTNDVPINSVKTIETTHSSEEDGEAVDVPDWIASNLENHHRGIPIVVRRPEFDAYNEADDKKLLKKIMIKARKLPQDPGKYASNHIMVNAERAKRNTPPLRRERHMDQIAREQVKLMAKEQRLFHIDNPNDLKNRLKEKDMESNELPTFHRIGTNIGKGKNVAEIHRFMMAALAERNNIRDKRFSAMGMGTYTAENGVLYMCQVFGG